MVLSGRLGLDTARVPHADRHGLLWLSRGNLGVVDGTLHFVAAKSPEMEAGDYCIPFQTVSLILLGPGTTISHDVFRLLARHGTGLVAVGEDGVRMYTAPPLGPNESALARRQVQLWANQSSGRLSVILNMYFWRLGRELPAQDLAVLRGIEGARMKEVYAQTAAKFGIEWKFRKYDRDHPGDADPPNQAINHAATAVESAATIAVAATGTIPQLGFIHEASTNALCLDVADLFRDEVTIPVAFEAVKKNEREPEIGLERHVRRLAGQAFQKAKLISQMIDRIKEMFGANDGSSHA